MKQSIRQLLRSEARFVDILPVRAPLRSCSREIIDVGEK